VAIEGQHDKRDRTADLAFRLVSINSTARGVAPGTGVLVLTGFAPTVTVSSTTS